jgi:toxin ParE1/3/4
MSHAEWTIPAEQDLDDIYGWIAVRDGRTQTAKNIVRSIRQECDEYARIFVAGSVLGTARADLGEDYRAFTFKRWVILFRPIDDGIEVMRVLDGRRNVCRIFVEHT